MIPQILDGALENCYILYLLVLLIQRKPEFNVAVFRVVNLFLMNNITLLIFCIFCIRNWAQKDSFHLVRVRSRSSVFEKQNSFVSEDCSRVTSLYSRGRNRPILSSFPCKGDKSERLSCAGQYPSGSRGMGELCRTISLWIQRDVWVVKSKGKVFYEQEPPSGEATILQNVGLIILSTTCSNLPK